MFAYGTKTMQIKMNQLSNELGAIHLSELKRLYFPFIRKLLERTFSTHDHLDYIGRRQHNLHYSFNDVQHESILFN